MDSLFVELFRRGAERGLERQTAALQSPQPLWALWEALHDHINNVRTVTVSPAKKVPSKTATIGFTYA